MLSAGHHGRFCMTSEASVVVLTALDLEAAAFEP
jgi:hypothetical protein